MELRDYIEDIEPLLSKNDGRSILRCIVEFSKLLSDIMPESGKEGIVVAEKFLRQEATSVDLETSRVAIWNDYDKNFKETQQGEALRTVVCALFFQL